MNMIACTSYLSHPEGMPPKETYRPGCDSKTAKVDCISNWEELYCILQEAKEKGIFVILSSRRLPFLLLVHIHKQAGNASGAYSNSYCQLSDSDEECKMIAVYSQSIFQVYPGALLFSLGVTGEVSPNFQRWLSITIVATSWSLPLPFCSWDFYEGIINIVHEVHKWFAHTDICIHSMNLWALVHSFSYSLQLS